MSAVVMFSHKKKLNMNYVSKKVPVATSINPDDRGCMHYKRAKGGRPAYYHYGVKVEVKYINLHFYNLTLADLGHTCVFDVDVFEKDVDGETHTYLNLYKVEMKEGDKTLFRLKIGTSAGDFRIAGTNSYVAFERTQAFWDKLGKINSSGQCDKYEDMGLPVVDFGDDEAVEELSALLEDEIDRGIDDMLNKMIDATTAQTALDRDINNLREQFKKKCEGHNS